jgi:hypothetical protein
VLYAKEDGLDLGFEAFVAHIAATLIEKFDTTASVAGSAGIAADPALTRPPLAHKYRRAMRPSERPHLFV